ncbi:MAG: hypothetical protein N2Z81_03740 [Hydrogenothermaceae bacterium]|nr:hypothetical protein [Hydrogenothermaceae bacterium]
MVRKIFLLFGVVFAILITSCAKVVNTTSVNLRKDAVYVVLPFENLTETPLAGLRVASIVEGVALSKGYKVKNGLYEMESKEYTKQDIDNILNKIRDSGVDYVITGSINEFRYKTGIDGEPAVSITLKIYDLKNDKTILTNVGSRTGWSHESVTTVAQKVINNLMP